MLGGRQLRAADRRGAVVVADALEQVVCIRPGFSGDEAQLRCRESVQPYSNSTKYVYTHTHMQTYTYVHIYAFFMLLDDGYLCSSLFNCRNLSTCDFVGKI